MKRSLLVLLCGVLAACDAGSPVEAVPAAPRAFKPAPGHAALYHEFEIQSGKSVAVANEGLNVSLASVDDSRCPMEARCISPGNARVKIRLSKSGSPSGSLELNTFEGPRTGVYAGYEVELVDVTPSNSIYGVAQKDYRAVVVVRRVPVAGVGQPFTLALGGVAAVSGADVEIRFVRVADDSRCGADVVCVWEGNARIEIEARSLPAGVADLYSLNTTLDPKRVVVGSHVVELLGLSAGPAYEGKFVVTAL